MQEIIFRNVDGVLICNIPDKKCLDGDEVTKIASYTVNTWQQNRGEAETYDNTVQGKLAEYALEQYLERQTSIRYLSYDKFRSDNFKKHAPFDGLIFSAHQRKDVLDQCIEVINNEVYNNGAGQITERLRETLVEHGVFTIEIKSSQLRDKDYKGVLHIDHDRTDEDYKCIVENIRKWDYFVYPHYTRRSDQIASFYEYAEQVRRQAEYADLGNQEFLKKLMLKEYRNACDIYTRLYFDYKTDEIFIPGYILKLAFYRNPHIGKMPGGKSGMALYYMRSISLGTTFLKMEKDQEIWNYDKDAAYSRLFAYHKKRCPNCGGYLQICNVKSRKTYSYRCFDCENWYTLEQIN